MEMVLDRMTQYYKEVDTPWVNQIFNNIPIRIPVDILNKQVDSKVCIK